MALKKSAKPVKGTAVACDPDPELSARFPLLWEFLTATQYDDGSPRVTASLTLFAEDGSLKACLSDRDQSRVAFVSSNQLRGILEALEEGLSEGDLDWRSKAVQPRPKR